MIHVDRSMVVAGDPGALFELLSDPLRFPSFFAAFPRVELVSAQGRCKGARYMMLMHIGHIEAGGVQRVTEYLPPHHIAFASEGGIELSGSATLTELAPGRTEVRLVLDYEVPGLRLPARFVEILTRHVVDRHLQATLLSVKRLAEFDTAPSRP
jgi:ribosome-associated toxin RatA of RatAB toxin-antitoxin module